MTAAFLAMIACNTIDVQTDDETLDAVKTIPYTVQVGAGNPSTRATVLDDYQTLHFAEGDKLYITGTNIKGVLNIQTGAETASATFSGNLTYSGEGSPADNLELTATLVSAQQVVGNHVSVDANKVVTVNYPYMFLEAGSIISDYSDTPFCTSVNDAVQKYSRLTGTSTYGAKSFTLTQQTAFLNFEITFLGGVVEDTKLKTTVNGSNSNQIFLTTADVTTTTESGKVVAKFVLPVASGITTNTIAVVLGDAVTIAIHRNITLTGKVYNVKRSFYPHLNISNASKGQVIGSDGKNHIYNNLPDGVTAVAMICSVDENKKHGLALAMTDEGDGQMNWNTAMITAEARSPAFPGNFWQIPSKTEWEIMFEEAGSAHNLSEGFNSVGGDPFQYGSYGSRSYYSDDEGDWVEIYIYGWQWYRMRKEEEYTPTCHVRLGFSF